MTRQEVLEQVAELVGVLDYAHVVRCALCGLHLYRPGIDPEAKHCGTDCKLTLEDVIAKKTTD